MIVLLGSLAVSYIPAIILYFYLRNIKKDNPDYRASCRSTLIKGVLCSIGAFVLSLVLDMVAGLIGINQAGPIAYAVFKAFVQIAFAEELMKGLMGLSTVNKNRDTVTWLDCIAYFAIAGIGFELIETIVYLFESNAVQIIVRGLTLMHAVFGLVMGYFAGKAFYTGKKSYLIPAFLLPVFLHGMYDLSLADAFQSLNDNLVFIPFILVIVCLVILIRMVLLIKKESHGTRYTALLFKSENTSEI